jgi:hypothetical protein
MNKFLAIFLLFLILVTGLTGTAATRRVVAVGDIHGDFDDCVAILKQAGLIDANLRWSGGDAILVQTGDMTDRGPRVRAVLDLLMGLQKEAPRQKGQVTVLMGNHEAMNIMGDLRYVTVSDYASFADGKSEARRKSAYESYGSLPRNSGKVPEAEWMKSHPAGFIEHREAFGPNGKYGKWLRSLPAVGRVGDTIFLHGGISPDLAAWGVDKINDAIAAEIKAFDAYKKYLVEQKLALPFYTLDELTAAANSAEDKTSVEDFLKLGSWVSVHPDGPLWFRGYAQWSDEEGAPQLERLTSAFKVSRFVVGHTPQAGSIVSRFGGKVFLIDTGMLSSYFTGGRASALEIVDDRVTPVYLAGNGKQ